MGRCCIALFLVFAAAGYPGQDEPYREPVPAPPDVNLTIRAVGGAAVFQIGERIELELLFTSTVRDRYVVLLGSGGSVLGGSEPVTVAPRVGWEHPRGDFDQLCPVIIAMSSLGSTQALSVEPVVTTLELNDLVRFKDPGEYQISVQSQSAFTAKTKTPLILNSNQLQITILAATEQWQEQTLRNAVAVLDGTGSFADLSWPQSNARWRAVDTLRYLGTPAAAREMVRWLKSDDLTSSAAVLRGLVASPAREPVLDQMKALLVDPDFKVDDHFLCAISYVALGPDRSAQTKDQLQALAANFRNQLRSALKTKRGNREHEDDQ